MNTDFNIDDFVTTKIKQHYSITTSEQFSDTLQKRVLQELEFKKEDKRTSVFAGLVFMSIFLFMMALTFLILISSKTIAAISTNSVIGKFYFMLYNIGNKLLNVTFWEGSSVFYYLKITFIGILIFFSMEKLAASIRFKRPN